MRGQRACNSATDADKDTTPFDATCKWKEVANTCFARKKTFDLIASLPCNRREAWPARRRDAGITPPQSAEVHTH